MGSADRRRAGSARGVLTGAALLALGAALGVAVGSLIDAPRLLLRRLVEPAESVRLEPEAPAPAPELREFRALQEETPPPPRPRVTPAPAPAPPVSAAPEPAPSRASADPAPSAEAVIREIAARRGGEAPAEARVVQVGAFADARTAGAAIERLRELGFDAYLSATQPDGTYRHRVRVRPAPGADVPALVADLERNGFSVWVTVE